MIISQLWRLEVQHAFAWTMIKVLEAEVFLETLKGMLFARSLFLFCV